MFRLRKTWLLSIPIAAALAWLLFPRGQVAAGIPFVFAVVVLFVVGLLLSAFCFLVALVIVSILPNRSRPTLGEHVFTLTDSEFQEVNAAGSASVKLNVLRRYETHEHIYLITPSHVGYILPMRDLQSSPDFLRMLRERTNR